MTRKRLSAAVLAAFGDPGVIDPLEARLRGLRNLARRVFVDRNAAGVKEVDRLRFKTAMRPHLRQAIHWARISRDALQAGDIERHELLRDRARMYVAFARLELFQPHANILGEHRKVREANSLKGGEATKARNALPELDALIDASIERGEPMRTKEWTADFGKGLRTVQRRIEAKKPNAKRRKRKPKTTLL